MSSQTVLRKEQKKVDAQKYYVIIVFCIAMMGIGFIFNSPREIMEGMYTILTSPSRLLTDYIEISSIGATFFNAGFLTLLSTLLVSAQRVKLSGPLLGSIFMVFGFSLFGKNIFNSIPIALGVFMYAKVVKRPFSHFLLPALLGTCLGPVVSHLAFGMGFDFLHGLFIAYLVGAVIGFVLPPLSAHFLSFHQGFNLYNMGFTAGLVGMAVSAILKNFEIEFYSVLHVSEGNNLPLAIIMFTFSSILILMGVIQNGRSFRGYGEFLKHSGKLITDYIQLEGMALTMINMGLQGMIMTSFVLLVGGQLSGPVLGGIFGVIGFSAFGKNPLNSIPVIIGVMIATLFNATPIYATGVLLSALFGTTLAPISGFYGPLFGVIAGFLHQSIVVNIGFLHSGMNLYNNGFSGGFVAAILVPIFDTIKNWREGI